MSSVNFFGRVLDVGGKKDGKRGDFAPPYNKTEEWLYVNIDESTSPDFLCSAEHIPVSDNIYDFVVCAEVLEHIKEPKNVLNEIFRVLKKDGTLIATIPFLYQVHADPYDYQRWTSEKILFELQDVGFTNINIQPMGGVYAVVFDLIDRYLYPKRGFFHRKTRKILRLFNKIFLYLDKQCDMKEKITTGYYIEAIK
jgi:ubiquinone/menaquinone biosynthesis C-methylase UbiE